MKSLFKTSRFFKEQDEVGNELKEKFKEERPSEDFYRFRWEHDKVVRSTHGVNCTGSCSWRVYVKKGIVTWELQATDYPRNRPEVPNHEPRGCPRGASYSWYLYNSGRVKHPMVRYELLKAYRDAKVKVTDPVLAWTRVMESAEACEAYKSARGLGGFVRASWDEALEIMAAANIYTIKKYGPDRIAGFTPIPAFSMVSYASGTRYLSLIGGTALSFYDFYCDLPPSSPQTWGEQTDVPESASWYDASYLILWGSNVPVTRTPDSPFLTQVRYKGTKVAVIAPDYSCATKFADTWISPKPGTDSAVGMAMGHVILNEFYVKSQTPYFIDYIKKYTDLPFLVKLEKCDEGYKSGMMLRPSDFSDGMGISNQADWHFVMRDEESGRMVVPNGTMATRYDGQKKWNLKWEDVRDGSAFKPQLSMNDDKEEYIEVAFPYFGGKEYKNPYYNATSHEEVLKCKVPVRKYSTKEGDVYCTTVYDLLLANYGVDRGFDDPNTAKNYSDNVPYTPAWQEQITGVPANQIITVAREFADNAAKTQGRSMVIIGAGVNQWYNTDMTYRSVINLLMLCGTVGQTGGGWSHYVGQEKVRPLTGWATLAFAADWVRPARQMNSTSYIYMHSDQWRYEKVSVDGQLSPLADKSKWDGLTLLDCNLRSQRMGWLPASPEWNRNPIEIVKEAEGLGKDPKDYLTEQLSKGNIALAAEDLDNPINFPRNLFIWRSNLIGCSAKGMEYVMRHLLGAQNNVLGKDIGELGLPLPRDEKWHEKGATGKLDLVVTADFRMTTSSLHSDIVLPAASWYEKNDISSTDMHPFIHPFCQAVDPVWESQNDWDWFKALAKKFSDLCVGHLGVEKDMIYAPILHDSPAEIVQPMGVKDWKDSGEMPQPGINMGHLMVVERNYPDTYKKFTSLGPLITKVGMGAKGVSWNAQEAVDLLKRLNGTVQEPGDTQGLPKLDTDIEAVETILTLAPETNGEVAVKAWQSQEERTGLSLTHLIEGEKDTQYRYRDLIDQPRRALVSPVWSGVESSEQPYSAYYINVHEMVPWRTSTGRQCFYMDHPWMQAFGENLVVYKPPLCKKEVENLKERLNITEDVLTLNLMTPHNKWSIHSSWSDNLLMLTLGRGGPVIWISETDAAKIDLKDNDWVEVLNDNGAAMCRAVVSQRIPEGGTYMYHNQERMVNVPLSPTTGNRGGIHNSISRLCPKPTHMIGGYGQLSYSMNYYGTIGANRDEIVLLRKCDKVQWGDEVGELKEPNV